MAIASPMNGTGTLTRKSNVESDDLLVSHTVDARNRNMPAIARQAYRT
jgi:hypothetical protein